MLQTNSWLLCGRIVKQESGCGGNQTWLYWIYIYTCMVNRWWGQEMKKQCLCSFNTNLVFFTVLYSLTHTCKPPKLKCDNSFNAVLSAHDPVQSWGGYYMDYLLQRVINYQLLIFTFWFFQNGIWNIDNILSDLNTSESPIAHQYRSQPGTFVHVHVERLNGGKLHVRYTGQLEWLHVYSHPKVSE